MDLRAALIRSTLDGTARVAPRLAGRMAGALFARPVARASQRPEEEPVMRRATRTELVLDGRRAVVHQWGDGVRPVLLMHGWQFRASRWSPLVTALTERGYSPVAFDAPGHGESPGRSTTIVEYRAIARRLHREHGRFAAVVGHSVGGLAAYYAVRGGVEADRLVAISAPSGMDTIAEGFRLGLGVGPWLRPALRRRVEEMFPDEPGLWDGFNATHRPEQLALPMLIVHDEEDDMIPAGESRRVAAVYGDRADLLITRGLGHRRVLADPRVVEAVLDFAAATDPVA
ncbi:alpha/beta hydrolase [Streptomyces sp. DSM 44917]|uniref:Alpha/beta hydrolase n=1 Tax=Streptomyces boetiae TaxID=3075541 RepID=A0ABU2LAT2_9ACTN|nr:alpha/beta hydrolase [Streptomyces sp. DSM 44917]MDT0308686.1 alpha/beta hydrolase [Streptomyces sp. DSM 44917]